MKKKIAFVFALCAAFSLTAENEITVGTGESAVNTKTITADGTGTPNTSGIVVRPTSVGGYNVGFYGIGAVNSDATSLFSAAFVDKATLTNNGTITMQSKLALEKYSDASVYGAIYGRGLIAGKDSKLENNGTISFVFNEKPENSQQIFFHGMYAGDNSTITNNGKILITGNGSLGAQIRGIATSAKNLTLTNNGLISADVATSYMLRLLAGSSGAGGVNINNTGTLYGKTSGSVLGLSTKLTNNTYKTRTDVAKNSGYITVISNGKLAGSVNNAQLPITIPGAFGMGVAGANADICFGTATNTGIIRAYIQGDSCSPYTGANGISVFDMMRNAPVRDAAGNVVAMEAVEINNNLTSICNTGIIEVASSVQACEENQNTVRASEIGINAIAYTATKYGTAKVKILDYATTLRDFTTTKNLIQAYKADIDLSSTNLILRPERAYKAGTAYAVSGNTLVTRIKSNYVDETGTIRVAGDVSETDPYGVTVKGMDTISFTSALPDFISVRSVASGSGDNKSYSVSLSLNNDSGKAKELVNAAAMLPVDFVRLNMDILDREFEGTDRIITRKVYVTPFGALLSRKDGTDSKAFGGIFGFDWGFGERLSAGVHGSYALAKPDDNSFCDKNDLSGFGAGLHAFYSPVESWWICAQGSFYRTAGDANYGMKESTGNILLSEMSNDANVLYASIFGGKSLELSSQNEIRPEVGFSYMHFLSAHDFEWSYMGYHIKGYDMEMNAYRALNGTAKVTYIHDFADEKDGGSILASAGVRARLYAPEVTLSMLGEDFDDGKSEDIVQGLVDLSYRHQIGQFFMDAGYRGVFGADSRNHQFHLSGKLSF